MAVVWVPVSPPAFAGLSLHDHWLHYRPAEDENPGFMARRKGDGRTRYSSSLCIEELCHSGDSLTIFAMHSTFVSFNDQVQGMMGSLLFLLTWSCSLSMTGTD